MWVLWTHKKVIYQFKGSYIYTISKFFTLTSLKIQIFYGIKELILFLRVWR